MQRLLLFILPLFIGLHSYGQSHPLDNNEETIKAYEAAARSFARGEANTALRYYKGILAEIIILDGYLQKFVILDERDAPFSEFDAAINTCLNNIKRVKKSLKLYKKETWGLRQEMEEKTLAWVNSVQGLIKDYLVKLAEPLSRADETWVDAEFELYEKYLAAYDKYLKVDEDWVAFQYEFAKANDFPLGGEIDANEVINGGGSSGGNNSK